LSRQLTGELKLYFDGQHVGTVTDHVPLEYPLVHGKFTATEMDPQLHSALDDYQFWWLKAWGKNDAGDPPPTIGRFRGEWWLELRQGARFDCSIPVIDFHGKTILWRHRS
jgi:hypothetical protein